MDELLDMLEDILLQDDKVNLSMDELHCSLDTINDVIRLGHSLRQSILNIITSNHMDKLLENYKKGLELLIEYRKTNKLDGNRPFCEYNIDEYWKKLQSKDRWYSVVPSLCIQKDGYSDCTKKMQKYAKNKFS
jgi:hypothetical protein